MLIEPTDNSNVHVSNFISSHGASLSASTFSAVNVSAKVSVDDNSVDPSTKVRPAAASSTDEWTALRAGLAGWVGCTSSASR